MEYDYLTLLEEPHGCKNTTYLECKCKCGRRVYKALRSLERESVFYKSCKYRGCEYSRQRKDVSQ